MLTISFRKLFCAAFIAASASSLYAGTPSAPSSAPDAEGTYQPTESNLKARAAFSHQLKTLKGYEIETVLAGDDGWNPVKNGNHLLDVKR